MRSDAPEPHAPPATTLDHLRRIAGAAAGTKSADGGLIVRGIATIADAGPEHVTWIAEKRFASALATSRAGAVIMPEGFAAPPMPAIVVPDVEAAIAKVLAYFDPVRERPVPGIHPTAVIGAGACIEPTAAIGAQARVGEGARIGAGTVVHPGAHVAANVAIGRDCSIGVNAYIGDHCRLGDRVVLKPGAVIGSDGFGFFYRDGRHNRVPQIGIVVLEDDVEIGANTCVDRAKVSATVIGRGSKIDNLVQVAHNCTFGPLCIVTAQVGLSGSTRVGAGVVFAGQAGTVHDVAICAGARLGARAVVTKDILAPGDYLGFPALPLTESKRLSVAQRRLPELLATIKDLTRRIAELEAERTGRRTSSG